MAACSRKCGSVRRKCSLKMARKAGFIRSLHESSRNGMFSRCGSYMYRCMFVCVHVYRVYLKITELTFSIKYDYQKAYI